MQKSDRILLSCIDGKERALLERLDKLLAALGCGSRREVGAILRAGRVSINDQLARDPATKVDAERDIIAVDGQPKTYQRFRYYLMNKPAGVLTATEDRTDRTVLDLLPASERKGLFPVGRLDKDTEGLLVLTDNGALGHVLTSPKHHVEKVYFAKVSGGLIADAALLFEQGILLADGTKCRPAELEEIGAEDGLLLVRVTLHEGKFHQVKRMIRAVGGRVEYLKRVQMGTICLPENLQPGEYRCLTNEECRALESSANNAENA